MCTIPSPINQKEGNLGQKVIASQKLNDSWQLVPVKK